MAGQQDSESVESFELAGGESGEEEEEETEDEEAVFVKYASNTATLCMIELTALSGGERGGTRTGPPRSL